MGTGSKSSSPREILGAGRLRAVSDFRRVGERARLAALPRESQLSGFEASGTATDRGSALKPYQKRPRCLESKLASISSKHSAVGRRSNHESNSRESVRRPRGSETGGSTRSEAGRGPSG